MMGAGQNSVSGTITQGTSGGNKGFATSIPGSTCTPASIHAKPIDRMYDSASSSTFLLTGFSSDPGAAYFTSLKIGAVTKLASSAVYSYVSGSAIWVFPTLFGLSGAGSTNWTVVLP